MKTGMVLFLLALAAPSLLADRSTLSVPSYPAASEHRGGQDSIPVDPAPEEECKVTGRLLRGSAQLQVPDGGCGSGMSTLPLTSDDASFGAGSTITTGSGSMAEVSLPDGSVVRVGPNSTLTIDNAHCQPEDAPFSLRLLLGSMWSTVTPVLGGDTRMEIKTENATIGVRGTVFSIETFEMDTVFAMKVIELYPPEYRTMVDGLDTNMTIDVPFRGSVTRVKVFQGNVEVKDSQRSKILSVGEGKQTITGIDAIEPRLEPIVPKVGFDGDGEVN